ncbi:UNVERIFIED_CONTAM: hypothetical protein QO022_38515, partial [Pseudomonas aeruginosa]
ETRSRPRPTRSPARGSPRTLLAPIPSGRAARAAVPRQAQLLINSVFLRGSSEMAKAKIIQAPKPQNGFYVGTTKNTGLSQRESLEEIMINLATALGVNEIHKALTARDSYIYEPQKKGLYFSYQSATNTILDLSRKVLEAEKARKP